MAPHRGYDPYADTVLYNGHVLTVDPSFSVAQALAVKDGRLVAVGLDDDVLAAAGSRTRRIDLGGRTVVPGFVDAHAHMDREGLRRAYPTLQDCRSIAEVQDVIRWAAAERAPGEWVVVLPLGEPPFHLEQEQTLAERRWPDRYDLDRAAPDHPVWVRSIWSHWSGAPPFVHVLNSAALRTLGIGAATPLPASTVEIERDAGGELTGRILERQVLPVAEHTLLRAAPRFTPEMRRAGLARAMRLSLAAGTTAVYEGHGIAAEVHALYKELHDRGDQPVRATLPISPPPWGSLGEAERDIRDWTHYASGPGFGDERLKVAGLYLGYGGHPEAAHLISGAWPYTGWAGFGEQYHPPDEYRALCRLAARHRLRVNTIITTTLDEVLMIWEEVDREHPIRDLRWVLVHARTMQPERDFPRVKRLGLVVTTQPSSYVHRSGLAQVRDGLDPEGLLAHRDYVEAGIPWALSTDNKPYRPLFTLWAAVARRERVGGQVIGPGQRVGVPQALRALTWAGAYVAFEEHRRGSLEVGTLADLLVLAADPLQVGTDALKDLEVLLTMVGGEVVHGADAGLAERDR